MSYGHGMTVRRRTKLYRLLRRLIEPLAGAFSGAAANLPLIMVLYLLGYVPIWILVLACTVLVPASLVLIIVMRRMKRFA